MTIDKLKEIIASGKFHHATYRHDFARGLHIYTKDENGFRGFSYAGAFSEAIETKELIDEAYSLVRKSGVYEGSYS